MCNPNPSSPSSFVSSKKTHLIKPNKTMDIPALDDFDDVDDQLHRWPTPSEVNTKTNTILTTIINYILHITHPNIFFLLHFRPWRRSGP